MNITRKSHPIVKIINNSIIDLPTPSNISFLWNLGSLLGLCLMIQIISGLILSMHYTSNTILAFDSISHICRDMNYGWVMRSIHANGASFFFICVFIHTGRGIYYSSFFMKEVWMVGVTILLMLMGTAFLGYVLPWGQMSFWGATVITNLLSAIPYIGEMTVQWIWGGFAIDNATLSRFFSLHFLLPFIILALMLVHLLFIHQMGSNNPLGLNSNLLKISFNPYFTIKDFLGFMIILTSLTFAILFNPFFFSDPENFMQANPLVTPIHIQPEWYFLFAYAILRSIPNKLGGVMALLMAILVLIFLPFINKNMFNSNQFYLTNQSIFWMFVGLTFLLTWIGARPVELPYIFIGQILSILYFSMFIMMSISSMLMDNLLNNKLSSD